MPYTMTDEKRLLRAATAVRAVLLVWGLVQDANFEVPYTDVDYLVFTDAARFVARGESPYERDTYRYSPLIAVALVPNVLVHPLWGKCLFAAGDLLAGWLIGRVLRLQGYGEREALASTAAWLFNPFTMTVSTRGSCESFVSTLMLTVVFLLLRGHVVPAAAVYGLATHLRIYPIIYALPLVLFLSEGSDDLTAARPRDGGDDGGDDGGGGGATLFNRLWKRLVTKDTITFAGVSAGVFFALGAACCAVYGDNFLREAFLYHLVRTDIRHNFSPSFYGAYLSEHAGGKNFGGSSGGGGIGGGTGGNNASTISARLSRALTQSQIRDNSSRRSTQHEEASSYVYAAAWGAAAGRKLLYALPQISVVSAVGVRFARNLPFCLFLQTLAFVAFNKVCTAQYFVWYFCLMPLALPQFRLTSSSSSWDSGGEGGGGGGGGGGGDTHGAHHGQKARGGGGGGGGTHGVHCGQTATGGGRGGDVVRRSRGHVRALWACCAAWLLALALWLSVAYSLEFRGSGVFLLLWGASVAFLGANAWLMVELTRAHPVSPARKQKRRME